MLKSTPIIPAQELLPLTARVTIGHVVCITEGITASVWLAFPPDGRSYLFGFFLVLAVWFVLNQFRFGKLGADINDLCFWDVCVRGGGGLCFAMGIGTSPLWYIMAGISVLKIYRVYARTNTITQESGWAIIGPMSYYHAKQTAMTPSRHSKWQMYRAFFVACVVAAIAAVGIKLLPDIGRVVASWIIPLWFELFYGPRQVRALQQFIPAFLASQQTSVAPPPATLTSESEAAQQQPTTRQLPPEVLATLTEAYFATTPEQRPHMIGYVRLLAEGYPAGKAEN